MCLTTTMLLLPLLSSLVPRSQARLVNVTIDDTHGDARSGLLPQYTPEERWGSEEDKPGLFNGTGHFTAWDGVQVNVTMRFHGTKFYVFISVWTPTNPIELSFFLDEDMHRPVAHYTRAVDPETNAYTTEDGVLAFASDALPLAQHELVVFSPDSQFPTWLFDYAMYTTEDVDDVAPGERTASHTGTSGTASSLPSEPTDKDPEAPEGRPDFHNIGNDVRLGASIGGAALLILLLVAVCWALRVWRRRQRAARASRLNPFNARPAAVPELRDKLSLWNDVAEKTPAEQRASANDAPGVDAAPGHSVDRAPGAGGADLRAQLERVRAEKTRALQEIAVLRRAAEPPPYSDSGR